MTDPRLPVATSALLAVLPEADALDLIRSLEIGIRRRRKQSLNASARSALTEEEKATVRQRYSDGAGHKYGLIKRLAREFDVSRETIRKTVREGCASSEADGEMTQPDIASAGYSHSHRANENDRP